MQVLLQVHSCPSRRLSSARALCRSQISSSLQRAILLKKVSYLLFPDYFVKTYITIRHVPTTCCLSCSGQDTTLPLLHHPSAPLYHNEKKRPPPIMATSANSCSHYSEHLFTELLFAFSSAGDLLLLSVLTRLPPSGPSPLPHPPAPDVCIRSL